MRGAFEVGVCVCIAIAAVGCGGKKAARGKIVTPVRVRQVEERTQLAGTRYSGTVGPATRVDLAFKVGGYVREIAQLTVGGETRNVQEGDHVNKGQVLAVIREGDYQQRVTAAQAGLAEATAVRKQAQLDFERVQRLLASATISKTEFDAQSAQLDIAAARVEGAPSTACC
jgi:multidrug efflux pump subunit AcrA (membrane-fusion protein)